MAARPAVRRRGVPADSAVAKSFGRFAVLPAMNAVATSETAPAPTRAVVPSPRAATDPASRTTGRNSGGVRAVPRRNMSEGAPVGLAPTFHRADSTAPTTGTGR